MEHDLLNYVNSFRPRIVANPAPVFHAATNEQQRRARVQIETARSGSDGDRRFHEWIESDFPCEVDTGDNLSQKLIFLFPVAIDRGRVHPFPRPPLAPFSVIFPRTWIPVPMIERRIQSVKLINYCVYCQVISPQDQYPLPPKDPPLSRQQTPFAPFHGPYLRP